MQEDLISACGTGNAKLVARLLKRNPSLANTATLDIPGWVTVLHEAAESGHLEVCKALIRYGADVNKAAAASGFITPLVQAAESGNMQVAQLLVENGAFVDGVDDTSISPLISAVDSGHHDIAKYLLSKGADVNRMDRARRYYALDFAIRNGDEKMETLLKHADGVGTQSDVAFRQRPGYPIISHVSNFVGSVYPVPFTRNRRRTQAMLHVAMVEESKGKLIVLFTSGVYLNAQRVDMNVVLPVDWPLLQHYRDQPSILSFPLDFLACMAYVARSQTKVKHGMVVQSGDHGMEEMAWPREFIGMVAVDYNWPRKRLMEKKNESSSEEVDLLTFVPFLDSSKPLGTEKMRLSWCEKKKVATWRANSFPDWRMLT